jgi:hypothetical protein
MMQELKIITGEDKKQYMEIEGKQIPFGRSEEQIYGEQDFFDMNPAARSGPTQTRVQFAIGDLRYQVVYDHDNPASGFSFFAEAQEDGSVELSVSYYLQRGGEVTEKVGVL